MTIKELEQKYEDIIAEKEASYKNEIAKKEFEIAEKENKIAALEFRLAQLEKAIFGSKRERFIPNQNPHQGTLFDVEDEVVEQPSVDVERKVQKKVRKKRGPRNTFPARLQRVTQVIEPENKTDQMVHIGTDETEILEYEPMKLFVRKIQRPRYANKLTDDTIHQAAIPPRMIPKGMVANSFISGLIVDKFEYHLPVHRFVKKLKSEQISFIKEKHCYNYLAKTGAALQPLHDLLLQEMFASQYNQMDESGIRVLKKNKANSAAKGCMWVLYAPKLKTVCFNYRPTKEKQNAYEILDGYKGVLQTDGNPTYKSIANAPPKSKIAGKYDIQISHFLNCWAHARRKFVEANQLAPDIIEPILILVKSLYMLERKAREENLTAEQTQKLRQQKAVPILNEIKQKLDRAIQTNITGVVRTAFQYTIKRWEELCRYTENGDWQIDNNLLENKIRPLALGRKNYLFAGTDETAQHIATYYSLIGTCQLHNINTFKYFNFILHKINTEKITKNAVNWLPHKINPDLLE